METENNRAENPEVAPDATVVAAETTSTESSPDSENQSGKPQSAEPTTDKGAETDPDVESEAIELEHAGKRAAYIPRERFDKVNGELVRLRPYLSIIEQVEAAGGVEAIEAFRREQAQMAQEAARENVVREYQTAQSGRLSEYVESDLMDASLLEPLSAELAELEYRRSQDAQRDTTELKQQFELQLAETVTELRASGLQHLSEYAIRLAAANGEDIMEAAQRSHDEAEARIQNEITARATRLGAIATSPSPTAAGGAASRTEKSNAIPDPVKDPAGWERYDAEQRSKFRS